LRLQRVVPVLPDQRPGKVRCVEGLVQSFLHGMLFGSGTIPGAG
jgi:hypothetical protein